MDQSSFHHSIFSLQQPCTHDAPTQGALLLLQSQKSTYIMAKRKRSDAKSSASDVKKPKSTANSVDASEGSPIVWTKSKRKRERQRKAKLKWAQDGGSDKNDGAKKQAVEEVPKKVAGKKGKKQSSSDGDAITKAKPSSSALQQSFRERLTGSRFRELNEVCSFFSIRRALVGS